MDNALAEFARQGYGASSVNAVCSAQGISKGIIYHYFKTKDALYLACVEECFGRLTEYLRANSPVTGTTESQLEGYFSARMDFFREYPNEARIFFEALLNPQPHLRAEIKQAMQELEERNERVYRNAIQSITLRDGVTMEDALLYFRQMQTMFNGYFSSPAYHNTDLDEKVKIHEASIPKLFDFMLYGIAKGDPAK